METRIIKVDKNDFADSELAEAAAVVKAGGLVAFPTETVYGIGVDAFNPDAINRLCKVKCRPEGKPLSFHIANRADVYSFTDSVPPVAERLMDRFWPGPLTIIFPGDAGGRVGVRFPAHPVARKLIELAGVPMAVPSANVSGKEPAVTAEEVMDIFRGEVDFIVDGGKTELQQASTVVRISEDGFEVLREGIITTSMIRKLASVSVLFICTGNSCRSPLAEVMMKRAISRHIGHPVKELLSRGYRISSAGTCAIPGGRASAHAVIVARERGVDLNTHKARNITKNILSDSDYIFVMSPAHRASLLEWDYGLKDKVELLAPGGIGDPIGGPIEEYRRIADVMEKEFARLLPDILLEEKGRRDETDNGK